MAIPIISSKRIAAGACTSSYVVELSIIPRILAFVKDEWIEGKSASATRLAASLGIQKQDSEPFGFRLVVLM